MKLSLLTLAALVAVATADSSHFRKQADSVFLDKQRKVLKLYVGLGADTKTYEKHEHVPFPYNKPELYKNKEALESFMKIYERGLLDARGVFTLFCPTNRRDNYKIFDLFYSAKDFDTFFSIASWARDEFNPMQWGYTFTMALFHREDTRGIYVPPLYEILPTYFIQSEVMHQAVSAKHQGHVYGKFDVNNTGWEHSWHSDMISGPYKSSPKWVGDDVEIRMSYFREDVGLANFLTLFNQRFALWLSTEKYPDIHFHRRGEMFYGVYKWLKNRYNLERTVNGLTPVIPFEIFDPLPGYNSHIQDLFGRSFLAREDKLVLENVHKEGAWELDQVLTKVAEVADSTVYWDHDKMTKLITDGVNGLDVFAKMIFGTADFKSYYYYKKPFYLFLRTINDMVKTPNDRDYTNTAMGHIMTQPRDPAFYKVIASMDYWFERFLSNYPPYTHDELNYPGVSIEKLELDRLDTYFERYDWELTNGINFAHRPDRVTKKFEASQFRLNHKPFTYKLHVKSDKEEEVFVRFFLGPKTDVDGREYSLDQQKRAMVLLDVFRSKVSPGENVLERHSHQFPFYEDYQTYRPFYEKVNKSIETKEPFYYNELWNCGAPHNLLLPRGWKAGKTYALFAVVTKSDHDHPKDHYHQCHHNLVFDKNSMYFPFDRPIHSDDFVHPNMIFSSVKIFHEQDLVHHEHHHSH